MIRLLGAALLGLALAASARAACTGHNLLAQMPQAALTQMRSDAKATPFALGLYWRATRADGTELTLVGTYHAWDPRQPAQLATLTPALDAAQLLVTEVTGADEQALQARIARNPSLALITEGPSLLTRLGADWPKLAAEMERRGVPAFLAAKFKPWYAVMLLGMPPCLMADLKDKRMGLDKQLMSLAAKGGLPNAGLDDTDALMATLEAGNPEDQLALLRLSLRADMVDEDYATTMADLYFQGRTWESWNFGRYYDLGLSPRDEALMKRMIDGFQTRLLTDRNRAWAPRLITLGAGKSALVAIGAAHLSGKDGLLHLLQERGFKIDRLGP